MARISAFLSLLLMMMSTHVLAAAKDTIDNNNPTYLLVELILSLGVILVLIYLLFWLLVKRNRVKKSNLYRHLGGVPLGQNKSVQILELGNKIYILGVGDSVQLIHVLEKEEDIYSIKNAIKIDENQANSLRKFFTKKNKANQFESELAEKIEQLKEKRIQSVNQWLNDPDERDKEK